MDFFSNLDTPLDFFSYHWYWTQPYDMTDNEAKHYIHKVAYEFEEKIISLLEENGIDLSRAFKVPGSRTGTYLALSGPDGDMALAVSDMTICERIGPEYLADHLALLQNARAVVALWVILWGWIFYGT